MLSRGRAFYPSDVLAGDDGKELRPPHGEVVLGIDQGTSGTRCAVFNSEWSMVSFAYAPQPSTFPQPGWVEQDPIDMWRRTKYVIRKSLSDGKISPSKIRAIGITNQRETTVLWDTGTGIPIHNAIVWADTRTTEACVKLQNEGLSGEITSKTGLPVSSYFSATKIRWLLDTIESAKRRASAGKIAFGTVDSWLIWNLTRWKDPRRGKPKHLTDHTNASRTMLLDIKKLEWSQDIVEIFGIPYAMLPEVKPSSSKDPYGYTASDGPFEREIPICGDLGDQQASMFGQACFGRGEAKNTYGSGSFLLQNVGPDPVFSKHGLVSTVAYTLSNRERAYALEGSVSTSGTALRWIADILRLGNLKRLDFGSLAKEGSSGIYFVPAFSGLYAPNWDPDARGLIIGLTQFTQKGHLLHAALEAVCYQARDVIEAAVADTRMPIPQLKADGGASSNDFLMQLQADVLGLPVVRPQIIECTALGAALAAALGAGILKDLNEISSTWRVGRLFRPTWSDERRNESYDLWKRAVDRARKWLTLTAA